MAAPRESSIGLSARREATRQLLLDTAAGLFAEQGYHQTTVPHIVKAAGVGQGTFYEYFRSRRDILLALTNQVVDNAARRPKLQGQTMAERIRSEIYWYLFDHVEHLDLSKIWHDASNFDAEIADTRRATHRARTKRVRKAIEAGDTRPGLDPDVAAAALTAMLEEFAHRWFIEGDGPGTAAADVVTASETLTAIWLGALGLDATD